MNNAKNDNLEPGLRTRNFENLRVFKVSVKFQVTVWEPNSENFLDLNFAAPFLEKLIIVPDTNYITSEIRKLMLDIPSPCSFQNICLLT